MKRFFIILTILALIVASNSALLASANKISQLNLNKLNRDQFLSLLKNGFDIIESHEGEIKILAEDSDLTLLDDLNIPYQKEIDDVTAFYQNRNKANLTMGGFPTFGEIEWELELYADYLYPNIASRFSIGQTIQGLEQRCVKLSDNPEIDEDEPEVLYIALIHAREPAAGAAVLHFMKYLMQNYGLDPEITDLIDTRELFFIPVQNPDGYVYNEINDPYGGGMWRKNLRDNGDGTGGVDLNRNYGFMWGYDNLGSSPVTSRQTYRGTGPFSEPETNNLKNFVISRNFVIIHNVHCYSNLELYPWGYDRIFTHQNDFYVNLGDSITQYSGYTPEIGWTLYPVNGGADDWAWGDTISKPRIITMTSEIGSSDDGFWPDPSRIPALVGENIFPNLYLAKIADNPYKIAPPFVPVFISAEKSNADFTLNWSHLDSINPAVSYSLWEYTDLSEPIDDVENVASDYWEIKDAERSMVYAHSGSYSWLLKGYDSYDWWNYNSWLISKEPYFVKQDDSLKFWILYDIADHDEYFYAQISKDGGLSYENLPNNLTTNDNPDGFNLGNGITGYSSGWLEAKFDLTAYEGEEVIFRLTFFYNGYYSTDGVYIDDIENINLLNNESLVSNTITDTFLVFTEQPNGDYWYRVKAVDVDGQTSRFSEFMKVTVDVAIVYGDVSGDGYFDIEDLVMFIGYAFDGAETPVNIQAAEVTCDGIIDIEDIVFLVEYMFDNGPAPYCP